MFRCEITGIQSQPYESPRKLVTERRAKIYFDKDGKKIGEGWEIAKEVTVSKVTYDFYMNTPQKPAAK